MKPDWTYLFLLQRWKKNNNKAGLNFEIWHATSKMLIQERLKHTFRDL